MGNNGFSHFFRLGRSTSSAPNSGECQPRQNVEQRRQATFSGRSTTFYDPNNPYLAARPFLTQTSASQPITQGSAISGYAMMDSPEDPFAALAAYHPTSFEEYRSQIYSGSSTFADLIAAYLPDGLEITSQPSRQTAPAPVMHSPVIYSRGAGSPSQGQPKAAIETAVKITEQTSHVSGSFLKDPQETQQVSRQDNPPTNSPDSNQGYIGEPAPAKVMVASSIPLNPDLQKIEFNDPSVIAKVKRRTRRTNPNPLDEFLRRAHTKERPYACGYPDCGMVFESCDQLTAHMFDHSQFLERRCTYPECGPDRYSLCNSALGRRIKTAYTQKKTRTCKFCFQKFYSLEILKNHIFSKHHTLTIQSKKGLCRHSVDLERRNFYKNR